MKSFVAAAVIASVTVLGGILFNIGIARMSDGLTEDCDAIAYAVAAQNYAAAGENTARFAARLEKGKGTLASIINHEDLEKIELCLSELSAYVAAENKTEAEVRCKKLARLLERLPENYAVRAENIL